MDPTLLSIFLPRVLIAVVCGRVLLSLLPPGFVGGHRPRSIGVTLATSYLLGVASGVALAVVYRHDARVWPYVLAAWLLIGVVRWRLGPHAFVPQREPAGAALGAGWIAVVGVCTAAALATGGDPLRAVASRIVEFAVLGAVLLHGSASARRAPIASAILWIATGTALLQETMWGRASTLPFATAGAAFCVAWFRSADRRALWLAAIAFAVTAPGDLATWLGGSAALLLVTHSNGRRAVVGALATSGLFFALPPLVFLREDVGFIVGPLQAEAPSEWMRTIGWTTPVWFAAGIGVVAALTGMRGARLRVEPGGDAGQPSREGIAIGVFVVGALALRVLLLRFVGAGWPVSWLEWDGFAASLLPAAALAFAIAFLPRAREKAFA